MKNKCDVCDSDDVVFCVRDFQETPSESGIREFEPLEPIRCGCIDHPPDPPQEILLNGSVKIDHNYQHHVKMINRLFEAKEKSG